MISLFSSFCSTNAAAMPEPQSSEHATTSTPAVEQQAIKRNNGSNGGPTELRLGCKHPTRRLRPSSELDRKPADSGLATRARPRAAMGGLMAASDGMAARHPPAHRRGPARQRPAQSGVTVGGHGPSRSGCSGLRLRRGRWIERRTPASRPPRRRPAAAAGGHGHSDAAARVTVPGSRLQ